MRARPIAILLLLVLPATLLVLLQGLRGGGPGSEGLSGPTSSAVPEELGGDPAALRAGDGRAPRPDADPASAQPDPAPDAGTRESATAEPEGLAEGELGVRVLDLLGRPVVGHRVVLSLDEGDDFEDRHRRRSAPTDEHGLARFERDALADLALLDPDPRGWVRLRMRLPEPVQVPVDVLEPPAEPVVLQLPLGRVTVDLVDADGARLPGDLSVAAHWIDDSVEGPRNAYKRDPAPLRFWLPLDRPYRLSTNRIGVLRDHEASFAPLTRAAPDREHVLRLILRDPAYVGRLLGPDGVPLSEGTFFDFETTDPELGSHNYGKTLAGGRFRTRLSRGRATPGEHEFELTCQLGPYHSDHAAVFRAVVPADDVDVELGDVRLEPRPILVAGNVRGPEGLELPSLSLEVRSRVPGGTWEEHRAEDARIMQPGGEFCAFGEVEPGREWRVGCQTHFGDHSLLALEGPVPFEPGQRDVELVLVRGASLAGRVVGDRFEPGNTWAQFEPDGHDGPPVASGSQVRVEPDGSFRLGPLFARSGLLRIVRSRETLRVLPEVTVPPGEDTDLGEIDVDTEWTSVTVRVTGPEPGTRFRVQHHQDLPGSRVLTRSGSVGEPLTVEGWSPFGALDLVVTAEAHRPVLVEGATGEVHVHLEPSIAVPVELRGLAPWTAPDRFPPEQELSDRAEGGRNPRDLIVTFEAVLDAEEPALLERARGGMARTHLRWSADLGRYEAGPMSPARFPGPGRYRIEARLYCQTGGAPNHHLTRGRELVVEVHEARTDPVVVPLLAPAEALEDPGGR